MSGGAGEALWREKTGKEAGFWALWCYHGTREEPFRASLLTSLRRFEEARSFFELGCNSGPNLALAADAFPGARLGGVDVNAEAVRLGTEWLEAAGLDSISLRAGSFADVLPEVSDDSEDVVFTCYALSYLESGAVMETLEHALRVARLGLVLAEPATTGSPERLTEFQWAHDYVAALRGLGVPESALLSEPVPRGTVWKELNAVISADLRLLRTAKPR